MFLPKRSWVTKGYLHKVVLDILLRMPSTQCCAATAAGRCLGVGVGQGLWIGPMPGIGSVICLLLNLRTCHCHSKCFLSLQVDAFLRLCAACSAQTRVHVLSWQVGRSHVLSSSVCVVTTWPAVAHCESMVFCSTKV